MKDRAQGPKTLQGLRKGGQIGGSGHGNCAVEEKSHGLPDPVNQNLRKE